MTISEIKEYIDKLKAEEYNDIQYSAYYEINDLLDTIKSMLDELEQPIEIDTKKYFETVGKIASEYFRKASEQAKEILGE